MKKLCLLLIALPCLALLTACGGSQPEDPLGLPNPMTETNEAALVAEAQLFLPAPPDAENVTYYLLETEGADPIGEMRFTLDGREAVLRAQRTDLGELTLSDEDVEAIVRGERELDLPGDISGLYYDWEAAGTAIVKERPAYWKICGEVGLAAWTDAGTLYNLILTSGADQETLLDLAERAFVSVTDK